MKIQSDAHPCTEASGLWLSPVQVKVLSLTERNEDYAKEIFEKLQKSGVRVGLDVRNEKVGYKIREALTKKVPYLIIVGDEEEKNGKISLRGRNNVNRPNIELDDFIAQLLNEIETRKLIVE